MERKPSSLEITTAAELGKIVAYQEEIIKMLAEIIANDKNRNDNEVYQQHIKDANKKISDMVNSFLNRYRQEEARAHSLGQ